MSSPNDNLNLQYHYTDEKYFELAERALQNGLKEGRLTSKDIELIKKYTRRIKANVSAGRFFKITSMLCSVKRYFPVEFAAVDEDALLDAYGNIKFAKHEEGKHKGEPYSLNSKADWMKIVKRFFLFLSDAGLSAVPKTTIQSLKTPGYDRCTKSADDVLSASEIGALIEAAHSSRYKCYISFLYESGARSVELSRLTWGDVKIEEWGCLISLKDFKAGTSPRVRTVPVITYKEYLLRWKAEYAELYGDAAGDRLVFLNWKGEPVKYAALMVSINKMAKKAGIDRHLTLHLLRHSRITHCLQSGMSESLVKRCFWGSLSTQMLETYGHLTNQDLTDACMELAGVEMLHDEIKAIPQPTLCPHCFQVMPPNSRFCSRCGTALSQDAADDVKAAEQTITDKLAGLTDAEKLKFLSFLQTP